MFEKVGKFQILLGVIGLLGLVAVVFSLGGLYVVLTGGPDGGSAARLPAEFTCDSFNGDPDVGHGAAYGVTINTTLGALDDIEGGTTDDGFELRFSVSDPSVLNTSARHPDGTPVPVAVQNRTVTVADNDTTPFRLWIDTAERGTITRSELDICPPESAG